MKIEVDLENLSAWKCLVEALPEVILPGQAMLDAARRGGIYFKLLGRQYGSSEIGIIGGNYRETLVCSGLQSRVRAVCDLLDRHLPDLRTSLGELARVLKPGGVLLSTQPFASMDEIGQIRARMVGGKIEHVLPPQFHSDPVRPEAGTLVFQIPGWDMLPWCREAGFRLAHMIYVAFVRRGIPGVHVLRAIR